MAFPEEIQEKLEELLQGVSMKELQLFSEKLSRHYKIGAREIEQLKGKQSHLAYLVARAPATYAAVEEVMAQIHKAVPQFRPKTVFDVGAGPGTASMAVHSFFGVEKAELVERDFEFITLGKKLLQSPSEWIEDNFLDYIPEKKYNLVVLSYSLGEATRESISTLVDKYYAATDAEGLFVVIEPGTPRGYRSIMDVRDQLIAKGANLIAPCPHRGRCPLPENDWCHFSIRLQRTRLHRYVKDASLGYEDEKFSYIVASPSLRVAPKDRVIREPAKRSSHFLMTLCTKEGTAETKTISKKEKELFPLAKKANWGDAL